GPLPSLLAARGMPAQTGMQTQALARRALDFTPPAPGGGLWPDPRRPEWQCGGADAYLDALLGPMLDWAAAQTRLDPACLSLYGHSYGGLCALYALARHPGRFAHTICASPSLWWREGHIEALLDGLPDRLPADARVRLTLMAGTDERWYPRPADPHYPRRPADGLPTLPRLEALGRRLAHVAWLDCAPAAAGGGRRAPGGAGRGAARAAGAGRGPARGRTAGGRGGGGRRGAPRPPATARPAARGPSLPPPRAPGDLNPPRRADRGK